MKTSLKKLQKFAALKHHDKRTQKLRHQSHALDELARATQDMNDMKDCYDRLLSAAAATANSVYEFSESLKEIGDCLLEKTALNDDEESGKVLLMLGKTQLELQKFIDGYRSHIVQTITVPSESLLNELRIVEEMKKRCDDKRELYEDLLKKQKEKGKLRNSKGECFPSHQLQEARDEYDEEVNIFVFHMKSLKQGQSRSLLTQVSRHHTAQLDNVDTTLTPVSKSRRIREPFPSLGRNSFSFQRDSAEQISTTFPRENLIQPSNRNAGSPLTYYPLWTRQRVLPLRQDILGIFQMLLLNKFFKDKALKIHLPCQDFARADHKGGIFKCEKENFEVCFL